MELLLGREQGKYLGDTFVWNCTPEHVAGVLQTYFRRSRGVVRRRYSRVGIAGGHRRRGFPIGQSDRDSSRRENIYNNLLLENTIIFTIISTYHTISSHQPTIIPLSHLPLPSRL